MNRLFIEFPNLISSMGPRFTSHEFILKLFQKNQVAFTNALYAYRNDKAPMRRVTSQLSKKLHEFKTLLRYDGHEDSKNIFGKSNSCATWVKK